MVTTGKYLVIFIANILCLGFIKKLIELKYKILILIFGA